MQKYDSALHLSSRASTADEGAIIRMSAKTRALRAQGRDVVALTLGEPDFDTPPSIRDAAKLALDQGHTHYAPVAGIPELREAVAAKLKRENGLGYSAGNIVLANGVKQALNNAILSVVGPGDEVIILAPYWVSYEASVRFAGGTPVIVSARVDEDFKPSAQRIADAVTPRTKLIMVNSPCNPTGAVWSRKELRMLADIVLAHPRAMVLADEIYEYILFEGEMVSIGTFPGMLERTITLNGFSKGFAMTGWRLGYAAAPEPVAVAMGRMQSIVSAGANAFVQRAAVAALNGPRDDVNKMREHYRRRRDMVEAAFSKVPGLKLGPIPGTFYAFPDISAFLGGDIKTSEQLCDWLLEEHGVAVVPGSAFGAEGTIRLSFATSDDMLVKALERIANGLRALAIG